ncbi:MAG TPA: alpha/beta fold hydrolase, partial [Microthrixaceae bacterium]|nr:alpha/beta fold hydrolase [Microthrixaceae bacterium]
MTTRRSPGDRPVVTSFVAVPGAFRGAWYWERLAAELSARGDRLVGVDLVGADLDAWIASVSGAFDANDLERAVLVGHSMGGVVAQASTGVLGDRCARLVLLDSPLIEAGQRAVDV